MCLCVHFLIIGLTGSDTGRNDVQRASSVADSVGRSTDDNLCLLGGRSRSISLPTTATSQREYLQSVRSLAHAYCVAERNQNEGDKMAKVELGGCMTRPHSTNMIDTHHQDNRGRMDSELTSDSDHTYDMSPGVSLRNNDSSDVFTAPASDDEKAKIISRQLQELDSIQRSRNKRVADYVHGLPSDKVPLGEGGRVQDPKRQRLWSTGCERFPWEINSTDGVVPRQRMATVGSGKYVCM